MCGYTQPVAIVNHASQRAATIGLIRDGGIRFPKTCYRESDVQQAFFVKYDEAETTCNGRIRLCTRAPSRQEPSVELELPRDAEHPGAVPKEFGSLGEELSR